MTTLQKLGEDVETTLKQLVFGTVRRSMRVLVAEEMKRYAYLGPHELKILEMLSLVEVCETILWHKTFKDLESDYNS